MNEIINNLKVQHREQIFPGVVGSVGEAKTSVRFKQSNPDMKMRFDKEFSGKNESKHGSNVQDGYIKSYTSKGRQPRVYDSNWQSGRGFKVANGWIYQDLRARDRRFEPIVGSTGRYTWDNKVATLKNAKACGEMFLPVPPKYEIGNETPRGGQTPIVVERIGDINQSRANARVRRKGTQIASVISSLLGLNSKRSQRERKPMYSEFPNNPSVKTVRYPRNIRTY